ncbi:MAG: MarR family winged helix-turn-helix transcriptional regulator [Actinomycetota bacterium]
MHQKIAKKHPELVERIWALQNLFQTHRCLADEIEDRIEAISGLSLAENEVLVRLHQHGPKLQMTELATLLLNSKSGITRIVDRLVEQGFVTREVSRTDRRVTYAILTDAGTRILRRSMPTFALAVEEIWGRHLTDHDVGNLRRILRKVLDANGDWDVTRCHEHAGPHFHRAARPDREQATV